MTRKHQVTLTMWHPLWERLREEAVRRRMPIHRYIAELLECEAADLRCGHGDQLEVHDHEEELT